MFFVSPTGMKSGFAFAAAMHRQSDQLQQSPSGQISRLLWETQIPLAVESLLAPPVCRAICKSLIQKHNLQLTSRDSEFTYRQISRRVA
jgi:hypothetical protein